ncbi:MAG: hypothetical protein JW703_03745 [Candidatus Diapherotrites archaeon]|nr:hypothetical protein [Candidatus Diapherotrites archaeon]
MTKPTGKKGTNKKKGKRYAEKRNEKYFGNLNGEKLNEINAKRTEARNKLRLAGNSFFKYKSIPNAKDLITAEIEKNELEENYLKLRGQVMPHDRKEFGQRIIGLQTTQRECRKILNKINEIIELIKTRQPNEVITEKRKAILEEIDSYFKKRRQERIERLEKRNALLK